MKRSQKYILQLFNLCYVVLCLAGFRCVIPFYSFYFIISFVRPSRGLQRWVLHRSNPIFHAERYVSVFNWVFCISYRRNGRVHIIYFSFFTRTTTITQTIQVESSLIRKHWRFYVVLSSTTTETKSNSTIVLSRYSGTYYKLPNCN